MEKFESNEHFSENQADDHNQETIEHVSEVKNGVSGLRKIAKIARVAGAIGIGYLGLGTPNAQADGRANNFRHEAGVSESVDQYGVIEVKVPWNSGYPLIFPHGTKREVIDAAIAKNKKDVESIPKMTSEQVALFNEETDFFDHVIRQNVEDSIVPPGAKEVMKDEHIKLYKVFDAKEGMDTYYAHDDRINESVEFTASSEKSAFWLSKRWLERKAGNNEKLKNFTEVQESLKKEGLLE